MHITIIVNKTCFKKERKKKKIKRKQKKNTTTQIGTNIRTRVFKAGLLARSQFASGRSGDRSTRSRFSMVFVGPRANAELEINFLH
jgi:hypothetical protein